ncbi:bifunctional hydroxymethylpyrimidine kinase/phosphomethylpyrimidine kinase [Sphingobacterium sp. DK4209]|uniref:hydroxymethylpyrimidine kinase n=1 Tax=Sphingobacterium zhuxiongii TaxID=2662364 RepID=A0A5Q0Q9Z9_9SPHI|nr:MULTISPECIES: bifunctional hydroxymethylpyrimidine kinase/phosphomethylpyrimidine kinase [unclassified Sphingobacterium]MVZ66747.1 bifunctional hydroxymethylpyrimidine kinase/phosphomethylpyrimidine kinase [Sphingobacterium sp. DK4209]QGA26266.1 bifunctional hydroxymethylpyrimidine kinase/phosphomethylpyrimidine kinase [Sphingobacterium sp. dk4302]
MEQSKNPTSIKTVLSIAGFDNIAGAGLQADIKTISAIGCYATTIITSLPVQNTTGVKAVFPIPDVAIEEQLNCVFDDVYPDAIKIGMIANSKQVDIISRILENYKGPIVVDPVMLSSSGHQLQDEETIAECIRKLYPLATLVTPNLDEAAALTGMSVKNLQDMELAIDILLTKGLHAVLLKGGHLPDDTLSSLLKTNTSDSIAFKTQRIDTRNTRGTGCTLSAAIASYLALGQSLTTAVKGGIEFVHQSIVAAKDFQIGKGNGPLNHFFNPIPLK